MNKKDLRIVFLGTPEFAVESLDRLVSGGYNIVGVVTVPDKIAGRGHKLIQSPVKQYAVEHGLTLMQPEKLKDPAFVDRLRSLHADLFIVIAFRMLPEIVWSMPPLGTFNLHASLLPRYRGAAPINRAVMNGDTVTGVTTFMLKHEIDTGDILQQCSIEIGPDEDVGSVHDRLMVLGADLTVETVEKILADTLTPIPQDSLAGNITPTAAPKIFADDLVIDWTRPGCDIHNHVRGLSPYPAARTAISFDGHTPEQIKILKVRPTDTAADIEPGSVRTDGNRMFAADGTGHLVEILEVHPAGKKRMSAADFLRGARFSEARFV